MTDRLRKVIGAQLDIELASAYYPRERLVHSQEVRPRITIAGRELLQFASLDYLGLATDERVIEAGVAAMRKYGVGALASRLVSDLDIHRELELKIAEFMATDDAVVFTSGSVTNEGGIPAVIACPLVKLCPGSDTHATRTVFLDELVHSSIKDGIALARGARVGVTEYHSGDMADLEQLLAKSTARLKMIVTDGIFSTSGRVAPLREIYALAEKYGAVVYVDDSHAIGVIGPHGRGSCDYLGVEHDVDVKMGVVSKAFGTMGGFIAGDAWFIEYLRHCRPQIHSMPLAAAECAATIKAIEIAQAEPWRRENVLALADRLRDGFQRIGFDTLGSASQVVPILMGEEMLARAFADDLEERGIFCPPFEYPAVPKGQAVLRFCPGALHTTEDIDLLLGVLAELYEKYMRAEAQV